MENRSSVLSPTCSYWDEPISLRPFKFYNVYTLDSVIYVLQEIPEKTLCGWVYSISKQLFESGKVHPNSWFYFVCKTLKWRHEPFFIQQIHLWFWYSIKIDIGYLSLLFLIYRYPQVISFLCNQLRNKTTRYSNKHNVKQTMLQFGKLHSQMHFQHLCHLCPFPFILSILPSCLEGFPLPS